MTGVARFAACLLVMALAGPSLVTLTCEWMCAAHHQEVATTDASSCHEHHPDGDSPKLAAGASCHDLLGGDVMFRPASLQIDADLAIVQASAFIPFEPPSSVAFAAAAPHRPPTTLSITPPLRI